MHITTKLINRHDMYINLIQIISVVGYIDYKSLVEVFYEMFTIPSNY